MAKANNPLVSICILTYNYAHYLPEAIASCLRSLEAHRVHHRRLKAALKCVLPPRVVNLIRITKVAVDVDEFLSLAKITNKRAEDLLYTFHTPSL